MNTLTNPQWRNVRLGDIGQSLIGLTYSPSNVKRSGTLVLRSSNIQDGELAFDDNVYVDCAIPEKIRTRENDILICVRNGSRRLIGKSAILDRRVSGQTFGAFMAVYRSDLNPFLRYFFQSDDFKRQIDEHLGATINQITNGSLNGFVVTLPSNSEQQAITERLQDVDRLIATLKRLISKKHAIKQGMMQELLTGKTRLPGFTGIWRQEKLGSLSVMRSGGTPPSTNKKYYGGNVPWVSISDMTSKGKYILETETTLTPEGLKNSAAVLYEPDVVLYAMYASLGECSLAVGRVSSSQAILGISTKSELDREFLYHYLQFIKPDVKLMGQQGTQSNLNAGMVRNFEVPLPTIDEQLEIANVLNNADEEIQLLSRRLESAGNIKQGMMQELLTGRTRLPVEEVSS